MRVLRPAGDPRSSSLKLDSSHIRPALFLTCAFKLIDTDHAPPLPHHFQRICLFNE